ncbi:hypothetical protein L6452_42395 [Arctium lappa]|uniref:Uncharacterized protein n=1 Tax=Arctium lappa TaxID=4217 RepID=A0ACB8XJA1_ARCLA|nr:hypothetical protein L6452_42395 [Arctium lappa]
MLPPPWISDVPPTSTCFPCDLQLVHWLPRFASCPSTPHPLSWFERKVKKSAVDLYPKVARIYVFPLETQQLHVCWSQRGYGLKVAEAFPL